MSDGHSSKCKECTIKMVKANRAKRLDYYRKYDRERSSDPKRVQARKEYYQRLKHDAHFLEKRKESQQKYNDLHPEVAKAHNLINHNLAKGKIKKPA